MYCLLVVLRGFIAVVFKCSPTPPSLDLISDDGGLVMGLMIGLQEFTNHRGQYFIWGLTGHSGSPWITQAAG